MAQKVLVAYATKYGSTKEVAEAVAATLREQGLDAHVRPMKEVQQVDPYSAVVLGTPLYIGSWLKDTDRFLARHQEALQRRPVAVFALGPAGTPRQPPAAVQPGPKDQLAKQLAKVPWLKPTSTEVFAGKIDMAHLNFLDGLLAMLPASPLHGMQSADNRDWAAIRAWATSLAASLKPATRA